MKQIWSCVLMGVLAMAPVTALCVAIYMTVAIMTPLQYNSEDPSLNTGHVHVTAVTTTSLSILKQGVWGSAKPKGILF